MKALLVTRGSQGDIYPYLEISRALMARGHSVFLSLPKEFEPLARQFAIPCAAQQGDDITSMLDKVKGIGGLLEWMKSVIAAQFDQYAPLLEDYDLFIAANTEFSAPSIAEACGKPIVRTAFAPLLPSRVIPPPVMPFARRSLLLPPRLLWGALNTSLNLLMLKSLNSSRARYGLSPIKDQGEYAPAAADNYLLYSAAVGQTDPDWPYRWHIGGYLFGDDIPYDVFEHKRFMEFVYKDQKPLLFFTTGSCKSPRRSFFYRTLLGICARRGCKLALGADWWQGADAGARAGNEDVFVLNSFVPHAQVFPHCAGIVHHGGSGTTHSAARAGRPQLVLPLLIDQFYWGERVRALGAGPAPVNIKTATERTFERRLADLLDNPAYPLAASTLAQSIRRETGLRTFVDYLETTYSRT